MTQERIEWVGTNCNVACGFVPEVDIMWMRKDWGENQPYNCARYQNLRIAPDFQRSTLLFYKTEEIFSQLLIGFCTNYSGEIRTKAYKEKLMGS